MVNYCKAETVIFKPFKWIVICVGHNGLTGFRISDINLAGLYLASCSPSVTEVLLVLCWYLFKLV